MRQRPPPGQQRGVELAYDHDTVLARLPRNISANPRSKPIYSKSLTFLESLA